MYVDSISDADAARVLSVLDEQIRFLDIAVMPGASLLNIEGSIMTRCRLLQGIFCSAPIPEEAIDRESVPQQQAEVVLPNHESSDVRSALAAIIGVQFDLQDALGWQAIRRERWPLEDESTRQELSLSFERRVLCAVEILPALRAAKEFLSLSLSIWRGGEHRASV